MADVKKLHQRIELALEEKEYDEACDLARRAVKEDPEDGIGWYYLLLADNRVDGPEAFLTWKKDWRQETAYRQAVAHGGHGERLAQLGREWAYRQAKSLQQQKRYETALSYFEEAGDYKDSAEQAGECRRIVEEALAEQRRLEAEMEAREAAREEALQQSAKKESTGNAHQQEALRQAVEAEQLQEEALRAEKKARRLAAEYQELLSQEAGRHTAEGQARQETSEKGGSKKDRKKEAERQAAAAKKEQKTEVRQKNRVAEAKRTAEKAVQRQKALEQEAREAARKAEAAKASLSMEQKQALERELAARAAEGQRIQSGAIPVGGIEYAGKICEGFIKDGTDSDVYVAKYLKEDLEALLTEAKWGGQLEDEQAYRELEKLSSFWRVYGAERKEGELAARLYDAEQGAAAGLPWDDRIACYWAGVAASGGDRQGCLQLGRFYEAGIGVEPNFKLAGHFYEAAGSKSDAEYFRDHARAFRQICGETAEEYEAVSAPPRFEMSEAARRVGSYWKLQKRTEEAKLDMDRRLAARLQDLLAPMVKEFDEISDLRGKIDKRIGIGATITAVSFIVFGIGWAIFVLFMEPFLEDRIGSNLTSTLQVIGLLTFIPVCILMAVILYFAFCKLPVIFLEKKCLKCQRNAVAEIRKAYDQAVEETNRSDCPEYRQYMDWKARCQEMQKALGVKTSGWQHAYLMYYSAGIHGARNPDEADQNALAMEKRDSSVKLALVPSPIVRWLLERMKEEESPQDLLELAKQFGKNSRYRHDSREPWQPVAALECILCHAVYQLEVELKWSQHGFWRTNTEMLYELSRIYGYGRDSLHQEKNPAIGLILADFAAEIYVNQYRGGRKAALNDLVSLYIELDQEEEYGWAWKAWKERCPEFAERAIHYMIGHYGGELFTAEQLRSFANDILADPKLSEADREKAKKLLTDIDNWEKQKREEARAAWEAQQNQLRQAREAMEAELDRRERGLNILSGNGYMTNEELYLSGRQSVSDYVENDIYRSFRRSELEKRQREQDM